MTRAELAIRFTYHPPNDTKVEGVDQRKRYQLIREAALDMALSINDLTPASREQSLAITKLEEAVFWANAAIARNERDG